MRTTHLLTSFLSLSVLTVGSRCQPKTEHLKLDIQGHRGARGVLPENSIPAFVYAAEQGCTTLELDVVVSKDDQLIVSHEPWMNPEICNLPEGGQETEGEHSYSLREMTAEEIRSFDCGSKGNARFPNQVPTKTYKPLLSEIVEAAEQAKRPAGLGAIQYNIEIKHVPGRSERYQPEPGQYARLLIEEVKRLGIESRTCIQSFYSPALEAAHRLAPEIATAWLVEKPGTLNEHLARLTFKPTVYSPDYTLLDEDVVREAHDLGIAVIPWTVNDSAAVLRLVEWGVDGIISDFPAEVLGLVSEH